MIELSQKAKAVLLSAQPHKFPNFTVWFIKRRLGWKTYETKGKHGARRDIADLYAAGLIAEWFSPWSPPCYLTKKGEDVLKELLECPTPRP